jgi:ketosteroid isomerase-like protein
MADNPESVIQRYFTAFERHALPEMLELLHDEVQAFYPAEPHRDWRGKEAGAAVLRRYFTSFPDMKLEWRVEKAEPEPDGNAVGFYMRNRVTGTGIDRRMYLKYVVRDGRIAEVHHLE